MIDVRDVAAGLVSVMERAEPGRALLAGRRESHSRRAPGPALRAMRGAGAAVASALRSRTCHCYCQRVRRGSLHWQPAESNGHRRSPGAADHAFRPFSQPLRTRFGSRSTPRGPGRYRRLASPDGTHTLPSGWLILARFLPIGHPCSGYARSGRVHAEPESEIQCKGHALSPKALVYSVKRRETGLESSPRQPS